MADIPKDTLEDACQLVKANSIQVPAWGPRGDAHCRAVHVMPLGRLIGYAFQAATLVASCCGFKSVPSRVPGPCPGSGHLGWLARPGPALCKPCAAVAAMPACRPGRAPRQLATMLRACLPCRATRRTTLPSCTPPPATCGRALTWRWGRCARWAGAACTAQRALPAGKHLGMALAGGCPCCMLSQGLACQAWAAELLTRGCRHDACAVRPAPPAKQAGCPQLGPAQPGVLCMPCLVAAPSVRLATLPPAGRVSQRCSR